MVEDIYGMLMLKLFHSYLIDPAFFLMPPPCAMGVGEYSITPHVQWGLGNIASPLSLRPHFFYLPKCTCDLANKSVGCCNRPWVMVFQVKLKRKLHTEGFSCWLGVWFVFNIYTVKPVLSGHSKQTPKIGFEDRLSLNAGQKYCRKLQWEHSAIPLTFIKLPFVIKACFLSIFEWPLKTGFTV